MKEKAHVLIVDDEPSNLELMESVLQDNYNLAFAVNGEQALDAAGKLLPDCILLDIMMPMMDGYETCSRLKADERTRDIPVIFVTAKSDTEDEKKGFDLGAVDYIAKPIRPPVIKARLKTHLALKWAREEIEKKNRILKAQNKELIEAACLREDMERITRHDLKTPLNAIISFPRFMMDNKDVSEDCREYLKLIESAGYNMLKMINLSLDLFKMERGIYELALELVDIPALIDQILSENRHIFDKKRLSEEIRINGRRREKKESYTVSAEELLCYSMLANLIKNAIEASPEGERIIIDLGKEKGMDRIGIFNKGAVPASIRNRFFEKYVTSGNPNGTGLGTYSAKLIAETHRGSIELDTADEEGTTVTIRLPGGTWES